MIETRDKIIDIKLMVESIDLYVKNKFHIKELPIYKDFLIEQKLIKLRFPIKLPHYDLFYNLLTKPFNQNKRKFQIIKQKNKYLLQPSRWFKYYGRNICSKEKQDENHLFPFEFDNILNNFLCYEKTMIDINTNKSNAIKLYFDGYVEDMNGKVIYGQYEYYIDSKDVLFHRLFMPYDNFKDIEVRTQEKDVQKCGDEHF